VSDTINFIKPIYYGFNAISTVGDMLNPFSSNLSKIIKPYPGPTASMYVKTGGVGYLYFAYPVQNGIGGNTTLGSLKMIKDTNGFVVHNSSAPSSSAFTYSTISQYHVYRTKIPCSYYGDDSFQFIF